MSELYFALKQGLDISTFVEPFDNDTNFCYVKPELNKSKEKYIVYLHENFDGWYIYGITNNGLYANFNIGVINKLTLWNIDSSSTGTTVNMTVPLYFDIRGARNGIKLQKLNINKHVVDVNCDCLNIKKETEMNKNTVKKVKFSGPATIVFWSDGSKSVVKCKDEKNDPEKGLAMALAKGMTKTNKEILMKDIYIFDCGIEVVWIDNTVTEMYWKDETHDIEKHIALAKIKKSCALTYGVKNTKWYNKFQAIFKQYYKEKPVAKVFINLPEKEKTTIMQALAKSVVEVKPESETSRVNELLKRAEAMTREEEFQNTEPVQDLDTDQTSKILAMFNQGFSISKIAKQTGISEYYVKRYLDTITNPNLSDKSKKPERILRKALKSSAKKDKKERKPRPRMTSLIYPDYLEKEECDKLVELTKEKFANKPNIRYLSELQKYFIRECRRYKTMQLWGNGYSAYEIGQIIGIAASSVMRYVHGEEADKE